MNNGKNYSRAINSSCCFGLDCLCLFWSENWQRTQIQWIFPWFSSPIVWIFGEETHFIIASDSLSLQLWIAQWFLVSIVTYTVTIVTGTREKLPVWCFNHYWPLYFSGEQWSVIATTQQTGDTEFGLSNNQGGLRYFWIVWDGKLKCKHKPLGWDPGKS